MPDCWRAAGLATASYAVYAGITWCHYGPPGRRESALEADTQLDRFMPVYEAAERHHRRVAAPAEVALAAVLSSAGASEYGEKAKPDDARVGRCSPSDVIGISIGPL